VERMPRGLGELVLAEPLQEDTAVVVVLDRRELERAGDGELADQHRSRLTTHLGSHL
jgi:hypothetical protein